MDYDSWYITTVLGQPASAKNRRKVVRQRGRSRLILSPEAEAYSESFALQARQRPLDGDVILAVRVWYRTRRPDLDIALIKDLLQGRTMGSGKNRQVVFPGYAYLNDRQVKAEFSLHDLDPDRPRAHIVVAPIEEMRDVIDYMLRGEYVGPNI